MCAVEGFPLGTRVPVKALFENLEDGATIDQRCFPGVTREQALAVLESAEASLANAGKPRMAAMRSSKVLGTSSETTRSVRAKPKTASLNDSSRVISPLRMRKPGRERSFERGVRSICYS